MQYKYGNLFCCNAIFCVLLISNNLWLCCLAIKNEGMTLLQKCISLYSSWSQSFCRVWETQTDRDEWRLSYWQHNFSWPYHAVLSSRLHLALHLLLGWGGGLLNWWPAIGCCPNKMPSHSLVLLWP